MSHIVLLGGRGYYGQHVRWALEQLHQVKRITVASRHPGPDQMQLDVTDPSSFAALKGCDLIVNCTDTVGAPPDALAQWCLHEGATLMDMGADTATAERLLALASEPNPRGVVVVGVGIFPGLSTVLARQVAQSGAEPPQTLELGVRLSPLSGAGSGNCRLMAALLAQPGLRIEAGARIEGPAIGGDRKSVV